MMITEYPQFVTITCLDWKMLLRPDRHKKIVLDSLQFLVRQNRIRLFAFALMDNHMHFIWQMGVGMRPDFVQRDFLRFTGQQIKFSLMKDQPEWLVEFRVNASDRYYQFWERNSLSIELRSHKFFLQKFNYLHENPVKAGLVRVPEDYLFSSAKFYHTGVDNWGFLTHYFD